MFFVGSYELTIDAKNRLSIPFAIRSKMDANTEGRGFYVVPGRRPRTLAIYTEKHYEQMRSELPAADSLSEEAYEWRQFEAAVTAFVDPDQQGRILIPDRLLKKSGVGSQVVLAGVQDHLELWSRADFDAFEDERWKTYPQQRAKAVQEMNRAAAPAATRP